MKYMQGLDAIIKGFEKDKFLFVFEEEKLEELMESKFSILDEVRLINIGNELSMTLSIGVGVNGGSYTETYESARMAMDLALGRGGDQAVVRDGDTISYYGGKTQKVEKSTRVKARVKAHALREIMLTHDKIFVMGHPEYDRVTLDGEYKRDVGKGLQIDLPKNYYKDNDPENRPLLLWRAHANNLYTNWLNYYVYQSTPFDLMGTPDFGSISFE